jgi:hypothetical protein
MSPETLTLIEPTVEVDVVPKSPVEYFWRLIEAESIVEALDLWSDFDRRSAELRAMARTEDIGEPLARLGDALNESELWSGGTLRQYRAAIAEAILI